MKLFGTLIQPIITYASEIWISDYKLDLLDDKYSFELVHLKSTFSLGVHNKTSNLGIFPVLLSMLKFTADLPRFHRTDCCISCIK